MRIFNLIIAFLRTGLIFSAMFLSVSCFGQIRADRLYRENLAEKILREEGLGDKEGPRFKEILTTIREFESDIDIIIEKQRKRSYFLRLLGYRYMDEKMWDSAYKAFNDSISLESQNVAALYNRALASSYMAKSAVSEFRREEYFVRAEKDYLGTLEINPRYTPAMYALAVLLVFELDRASESETLLREFLSIERSHVNARFLLARVLYEKGEISEARGIYNEIEGTASSKVDRGKAMELNNNLAEITYGL